MLDYTYYHLHFQGLDLIDHPHNKSDGILNYKDRKVQFHHFQKLPLPSKHNKRRHHRLGYSNNQFYFSWIC